MGTCTQRDTLALDCPLIACPLCQTAHECIVVAGDDSISRVTAPPKEALEGFHALIEVSARTAQKLEVSRHNLAEAAENSWAGDVPTVLSEMFHHFAPGRPSLTIGDFRAGILTYEHLIPESVLQV